jgi:predicted MFS family arabinose efflux permease
MMPDTDTETIGIPGRRDSITDRLYDLGFFLVEAFAALEVTAVIVANARITESLGLREELSSYILNSYLYPLFAVMLLTLVFSRRISRTMNPLLFFLGGLTLFALGNLVCFSAPSPFPFFAGRIIMGIGGAVSFAGQLWTLSVFHRLRLTRTLVWGEVGAALGVVVGPMVGALFAHGSAQGWRNLFLMNAGLGLATVACAYLGLRRRDGQPETGPADPDRDPRGRRTTRIMTAWQVSVSILIVGSEYLFSDYLQAKVGKSPLFVGGMTVLASIGTIAGSIWAARLEQRLAQVPSRAAVGLLLSLAGLAFCLTQGFYLLAGIPIIASGICMGLASVSIYACIVTESDPLRFLPRSMVYLLGMQIGNALGVQAVGLAEIWHLGVPATAGMVAALPQAITVGVLACVRSVRTTG